MKKFWKEFIFRGLICASGGPIVLGVIYGILDVTGAVQAISPGSVCLAILSIALLAFVVAGMTAIYQLEQLPLPIMILLHGGALYLAYILTYIINGWLQKSLVSILMFTGIFLAGYGLIWCIIYLVERAKARRLNQLLKKS